MAERSAKAADKSTAEGVTQPQAPERSGSPASREAWDTLGREGRTFVAGGPTAEQISEVTGSPALTPIRVYAGRESAGSVEGIAEQVIGELERTHAFDRKVLAVATTTGRGWVNPNVASAFEYVNSGDTAIASMQYSFLPSALSFIADRETPPLAGQALFEAVHRVWSARPGDSGRNWWCSARVWAHSAGSPHSPPGPTSSPAPTAGYWWAHRTSRSRGRDHRRPGSGSFERLPVVDDGRISGSRPARTTST